MERMWRKEWTPGGWLRDGLTGNDQQSHSMAAEVVDTHVKAVRKAASARNGLAFGRAGGRVMGNLASQFTVNPRS